MGGEDEDDVGIPNHWEKKINVLYAKGKKTGLSDAFFQRAVAFVACVYSESESTIQIAGCWNRRDHKTGKSVDKHGVYDEVRRVPVGIQEMFVEAINEEMPAIIRRVRKKVWDARKTYAMHLRDLAAEMEGKDDRQLEFPAEIENDWIVISLAEAQALIESLGPDVVIWVGHDSDVVRQLPADEDHAVKGQCYTRPMYRTARRTMDTIKKDTEKESGIEDIPF